MDIIFTNITVLNKAHGYPYSMQSIIKAGKTSKGNKASRGTKPAG